MKAFSSPKDILLDKFQKEGQARRAQADNTSQAENDENQEPPLFRRKNRYRDRVPSGIRSIRVAHNKGIYIK